MNIDHLFLDVAVTNPNPGIGQILAIAAIRTDRKGNLLKTFAERVLVEEDLSQSEIDHLGRENVKEWDNGIPFNAVINGLRNTILSPFDKHYIVVSNNAVASQQFIKEAWKAHKLGYAGAFHAHRWYDIAHLAWPLAFTDLVPDASIESLCSHFHVENTAPETATGNVEAITRAYWAMMKRYRTALMGEEIFREVGGGPLAAARKILGL